MLIVSDTSPITNLLQIGHLHLLNQLFGQVIVPQTVYEELCRLPHQHVALDNESWLTVQASTRTDLFRMLQADLDAGEAEAVALALELQADYLIIDERIGRDKAESMGIRIVGLLGVLLQAKQVGFIDAVLPLLTRLQEEAGFRINPVLHERIRQLAGE